MNDTLYHLEGVHARYAASEKEVLRGITFTVNRGDWVLLAGPNGSGKSTLLRALAGDPAVLVSHGSTLLNGKAAGTNAHPLGIAYVPQSLDDGVFPTLTVLENLLLALTAPASPGEKLGVNRARSFVSERVRSTVPSLQDHFGAQANGLSGGWRAVLALTMALIRDPALLLVDEVTAALDEENARLFHSALKQWKSGRPDQTTAVVFVSHALTNARRQATRLALIREGQIVFELQGAEYEGLSDGQLLDLYKEKCW